MADQSVSRADSDFTSIYQRNFSRVYRLAYLKLGNRADAEDAVQTVFLRFYRKGKVFADPEHEKAYFLRAVRNECTSILRSPWRSRQDSFEDLLAHEEPAAEDSAGELLAALCALPEKYRELLILFYDDGLTSREIAALLKRNESTVRSQLKTARELLKPLLLDE